MKKRGVQLVLLISLLVTYLWSFGSLVQAEEANNIDENQTTIKFRLVNGEDVSSKLPNTNGTKPVGGNLVSGLLPHTGEQQKQFVLICGLIFIAIVVFIVFFQQKKKAKKQKGNFL